MTRCHLLVVFTFCILASAKTQCPEITTFLEVALKKEESACFTTFSDKIVTIFTKDTVLYNLTATVSRQGTNYDYDYKLANGTVPQSASYEIPPTLAPRQLFYLMYNLGTNRTFNISTRPTTTVLNPLALEEVTILTYPTIQISYYYVTVPPGPLSLYVLPSGTPFKFVFGRGDAWDRKPIYSASSTNTTPIVYSNYTGNNGDVYYVLIQSLCEGNCTPISYRVMTKTPSVPETKSFDFIVPARGDQFYFQNDIHLLTELTLNLESSIPITIYAKNQTFPTTTDYDYLSRGSTMFVNPSDHKRSVKYLVSSNSSVPTLARATTSTRMISPHHFVDNRDFVCVSTPSASARVRDYYSVTIPANGTVEFTVYMENPATDDTLMVTVDDGNFGAHPFFSAPVVHPFLVFKNQTTKSGMYNIIVTNNCVKCSGYCIINNAYGRGPYLTEEGRLIAIIIASILAGTVVIAGIVTLLVCVLLRYNVIRLKDTRRDAVPEKIRLIGRDQVIEQNFNYYTQIPSPELNVPLLAEK